MSTMPTKPTITGGSRVLAVRGRPTAMNPDTCNIGQVGNVVRCIKDGAGAYYEVLFGPQRTDYIDRECLVLLPMAGGAA